MLKGTTLTHVVANKETIHCDDISERALQKMETKDQAVMAIVPELYETRSLDAKKKDKIDRIKPLVDLSKKIRFFYTRQSAPLGNGHALLMAREFIGDEPFAFSELTIRHNGFVNNVPTMDSAFVTAHYSKDMLFHSS